MGSLEGKREGGRLKRYQYFQSTEQEHLICCFQTSFYMKHGLFSEKCTLKQASCMLDKTFDFLSLSWKG